MKWALVANPIEVRAQLPYEFAPGLTLNRASPDEIEIIQRNLDLLHDRGYPPLRRRFEWIARSNGKGGYEDVPLPPERWCYHILCMQADAQSMSLQQASDLLEHSWDFNSLVFTPGVIAQHGEALQRRSAADPHAEHRIVTTEELDELKESYEGWLRVVGLCNSPDVPFPEIQRAHQMLRNLSQLPWFSDFHVLGMFAIVEMLLTHDPSKGASIGYQLRTKIPLIMRRFVRPFNISKYYDSISERKLWDALYDYRSSIAHGSSADFKRELALLKGKIEADRFLLAFVKHLIRHSYEEPQLMRDLREC